MSVTRLWNGPSAWRTFSAAFYDSTKPARKWAGLARERTQKPRFRCEPKRVDVRICIPSCSRAVNRAVAKRALWRLGPLARPFDTHLAAGILEADTQRDRPLVTKCRRQAAFWLCFHNVIVRLWRGARCEHAPRGLAGHAAHARGRGDAQFPGDQGNCAGCGAKCGSREPGATVPARAAQWCVTRRC